MTRSRADRQRVPSPLAAAYYAQRASAGLIITEAAHISWAGAGGPGTPGMHTLAQRDAWMRVTKAVHRAGGRIFLQLWHVGRVSHPSLLPGGELPVAPSAIPPGGRIYTHDGLRSYVAPRPLTTTEIQAIISDFAHAARLALEAGFDGIDLHAGNGYLIDQFLRDGSNRRADEYGGNPGNRARFLLEVVEALVEVWGDGRVGVRLSPLSAHNSMHDSDPVVTFSFACSALSGMDLAYLHVVEPGPGHPQASRTGLQLLRRLRGLFPGPLIVDGGWSRSSAELVLGWVPADLVALATPFIANPDLVERFAHDWPLASADPETFYAGGKHGYVDYPRFGVRVRSRQRHELPRLESLA